LAVPVQAARHRPHLVHGAPAADEQRAGRPLPHGLDAPHLHDAADSLVLVRGAQHHPAALAAAVVAPHRRQLGQGVVAGGPHADLPGSSRRRRSSMAPGGPEKLTVTVPPSIRPPPCPAGGSNPPTPTCEAARWET